MDRMERMGWAVAAMGRKLLSAILRMDRWCLGVRQLHIRCCEKDQASSVALRGNSCIVGDEECTRLENIHLGLSEIATLS